MGQASSVSPYSRYGIGDLQDHVGAQGFAMGKTGIALRNDSTTPYFINLKNPASYYFNRITTFEAGLLDNQITLTTMGQSHKNNNAYFGYFALAFPVGKYIGACAGIAPMSSIGYDITSSSPIDSIAPNGQTFQVDNATTTYIGSGGINNLFLGLAFTPLPFYKNLSLGAHFSYLFGNITNTQFLEYPTTYNAYDVQVYQSTQVNSFYWNCGLMWTFGKSTGWNATLGGTLGLGQNLKATDVLLSVNYIGGSIHDTVQNENSNGTISMPLTWGGGLTLKKGEKWTFTAEYSTQNWSQFTFFGANGNLSNSNHMGFGIQFIPHKNFDVPHTYFQRVHYRAGFYMDKTYLDLNNTPINDYCVSAGIGLPIGRTYYMSRASVLNIGVQVGQLGTTANNLLQEKYVKLLFSFTFDDRWFVKRQFE